MIVKKKLDIYIYKKKKESSVFNDFVSICSIPIHDVHEGLFLSLGLVNKQINKN